MKSTEENSDVSLCANCKKEYKCILNNSPKVQRALIVHSASTKNIAKIIGTSYKDPTYLMVEATPKETVTRLPKVYEQVIGVGGGSVIDTAKIIAGDSKAIAIPTTASGASMTSYATIWGDNKKSVRTQTPILKLLPPNYKLELPLLVQVSTFFDALAHSFESLWSANSNTESTRSATKALKYLADYCETGNTRALIVGGNYSGEAIAYTKTNIVHSLSYPITLNYTIGHGLACGLILPFILKAMGDKGFHSKFLHKDLDSFVWYLKHMFPYYAINIKRLKINWNLVIKEAFEYPKIYDTYLQGKIDKDLVYLWLKGIV